MPKNLLQDIVKVKHSSSPSRVEEMEMRKKHFSSREEEEKSVGKKPKNKYALWLVAFVSTLFFLFAISYFFLKVVVTINPKIQDINLNENLSASKGAAGAALSFDLIVISGEENKTIEATETKDVAQKAEGTVIIYNAFGPASQLLSIDTRLEGSNGKIYKTKKALVVPGMKSGVPGSVEVGVYGTEAGEDYNSTPLDFTIFGFKGTPKYAKFYARSKGSIEGGFKGKSAFVSDKEKASAVSDLKKALETKLFKQATEQIPSGFILFKDGILLDMVDSADTIPSGEMTVSVKEKATLYGFIFDESKLSQKIAQDNIKDYNGSPVYVQNLSGLNFSFSNKDNIFFADVKNINFNLKGSAKVVWKLDENKFIADLLGKSKKDFKQILLQYPNIISADLAISPFWKMTLPDKSKDIKVIVNYPK